MKEEVKYVDLMSSLAVRVPYKKTALDDLPLVP